MFGFKKRKEAREEALNRIEYLFTRVEQLREGQEFLSGQVHRDADVPFRVRELELQGEYPTTEALAEGIREAVEHAAAAERAVRENEPGARYQGRSEEDRTQQVADERLQELVKYAGRSGLLRGVEENEG